MATRLANRCKQDGYRMVALQARREEAPLFCLRLLDELAAACQRLGRESDERMLRDGQRPVAERLRLAVEVLNESRVLLVLDNLESLMPVPPAVPVWQHDDFAHFYRELTRRLIGEGRAILTCRYLPWESASVGHPQAISPAVLHEPLPDFTEADFFKYLRRHDAVAVRIERGQLPRTLLAEFHRKLGGTPRFVEQAAAVLGRIDPDALREQLEDVAEPPGDADPDDVRRLQQTYFRDLFLPQLYEALSAEHQRGLSRLALSGLPLPLDGVARAAALGDADSARAVEAWLALGLVQRLGEPDDRPLYAVYPLQREMLTDPARLDEADARATHAALAEFWQECFEREREQELGLIIEVELLACLEHAEAAGDADRRRWAVTRLCYGLIPRAEYTAAQHLIAPFLDHDRHPDLLQVAARVALDTGNWREARTLTEEEQQTRQAMGDRAGEAATRCNLATIDVNEGNYAAARENFARALAMWQAIGDRSGEASTWHNLASVDYNEGNYAAARENCDRSLSIKQAIGDRVGEASTWHQLATIDLSEGNYSAARESFAQVLAIKQGIGDRAGEAAAWHNLATIDLCEAKYAAAREKTARVLTMYQIIGDRPAEAATWNQLATIDVYEVNYGVARENFTRALAMQQGIGDRAGEADTWHQLGSIDLNEGDYTAAREKFARSLTIKQDIGDRAGEAATWHGLGSIDLKEGNYATARKNFARSLTIKQAIGDRAGEAATWHQLASIDLDEGNPAAAQEKFARSLAMRQAIGDRAGEAAALCQVGLIAWESGRREVAIRLVAMSLGLFVSIGAAEQRQVLENFAAMGIELNLDEPSMVKLLQEAAQQYQRDRGAAWVAAACADA